MVRVKFFAILKSKAGKEFAEIPCEGQMTVRELRSAIVKELPQLSEYLACEKVLVSINQEFADTGALVRDGDEVAFLPPFSGG